MRKRCTRCGVVKPYDDFYVSRVGVRGFPVLQGDCKRCYLNKRRGRSRGSRAAYFREYRRRRASRPDRYDATPEMVPAAPFGAWLESVMARERIGSGELGLRLGIPSGSIRAYVRGGRASVSLSVVDAALIMEGGSTLMDVYPTLYQETA